MHKKYAKADSVEGSGVVDTKARERKKENNNVLFLKYECVQPAKDGKDSHKRSQKKHDDKHEKHKGKHSVKRSRSHKSKERSKPRSKSKHEDRHEEEKRPKHEHKKDKSKDKDKHSSTRKSTSSLQLERHKDVSHLRKEKTIHLEKPRTDMPMFKPFTAIKMDEGHKHKDKKSRERKKTSEKQPKGDEDVQITQQAHYCHVDTDLLFKNDKDLVETYYERDRRSKRRHSEAPRVHTEHAEAEERSRKKHYELDELIFCQEPREKHHDKSKSMENRDQSGEKGHKRSKSSKSAKEKDPKETDDIKSYFEKIQAAIDKKIDILLGPKAKLSASELTSEKERKSKHKAKEEETKAVDRKAHRTKRPDQLQASRAFIEPNMVQTRSDSRMHLKGFHFSQYGLNEEPHRMFYTQRVPNETINSQVIESKKPSRNKGHDYHEFKVEVIEQPNHQREIASKEKRPRNLECKTVSIVGIPSSIPEKSIALNSTQTNTSLKSIEDIVEKKKKSQRFKLYYNYSVDNNSTLANINSDEHNELTASYRILTDQTDNEQSKYDETPTKLTREKLDDKPEDDLSKRHRRKRRENLAKLNDIVEEKHDVSVEMFEKPSTPRSRDIQYEFFRPLNSSNSEYGLSNDSPNADFPAEMGHGKHPKPAADVRYFVNKPNGRHARQKHRWKYMSKSDVNISYDSLCHRGMRKKSPLEKKRNSRTKEPFKTKRSTPVEKEIVTPDDGDHSVPRNVSTDRSDAQESMEMDMKEYLKKIYEISVEIKAKFFESNDFGRSCHESQLFELLYMTDPRGLFYDFEGTYGSFGGRAERIQRLQNLSTNLSSSLRGTSRNGDYKRSETNMEEQSHLELMPSGTCEAVVVPADTKHKRLQCDPAPDKVKEICLVDSRNASSSVESYTSVRRSSHSKRSKRTAGRSVRTQTVEISEVAVGTEVHRTENRDVQTSRVNVCPTADVAVETSDIEICEAFGGTRILTPRSNGIKFADDISTKKLNGGKKVRLNQSRKAVCHRARQRNDSTERSEQLSTPRNYTKRARVDPVYVPREYIEIREQTRAQTSRKRQSSKEIISVNSGVMNELKTHKEHEKHDDRRRSKSKDGTTRGTSKEQRKDNRERSKSRVTERSQDRWSKSVDSKTYMVQRNGEDSAAIRCSSLEPSQKLSRSASVISSIEVMDNLGAESSRVASLICLQNNLQDGVMTVTSKETSQFSVHSEMPYISTMLLTKQYRTGEISAYQRRKMYDEMMKKRMAKRRQQTQSVNFEVRFVNFDAPTLESCSQLTYVPTTPKGMNDKVFGTIKRISEIQEGIDGSTEDIFLKRLSYFCQYLTKGDAAFNNVFADSEGCTCHTEKGIDNLIDLLRLSKPMFGECLCKTKSFNLNNQKDAGSDSTIEDMSKENGELVTIVESVQSLDVNSENDISKGNDEKELVTIIQSIQSFDECEDEGSIRLITIDTSECAVETDVTPMKDEEANVDSVYEEKEAGTNTDLTVEYNETEDDPIDTEKQTRNSGAEADTFFTEAIYKDVEIETDMCPAERTDKDTNTETDYDNGRATVEIVDTGVGSSSIIPLSNQSNRLFRKAEIVPLLRPACAYDIRKKRSQLFRKNVSDTAIMINYYQMAQKCREYAHKVRWYDPTVRQHFEEIPLDVLLSKRSLVSVDGFDGKSIISFEQVFDNRNAIGASTPSLNSTLSLPVTDDVIPWSDTTPSQQSPDIVNEILMNRIALSCTNLSTCRITLVENSDAANLSNDQTEQDGSSNGFQNGAADLKKLTAKNFFDSLLRLYEREMAVSVALFDDHRFFEDELLGVVHDTVKRKQKGKARRKGLVPLLAKVFCVRNTVNKPPVEASQLASGPEMVEELNDGYQQSLQSLAKDTRRYFSLLVEAVKMNQDIDDEIKMCGFLKLLDMIEHGYFTFIRQQQHDNASFEQEIRKQVKDYFTRVYSIAKRKADKCNRDLTWDDINLIRAFVCKYRIGMLSSVDVLAERIGSGSLKNEYQLRSIVTYLLRQSNNDMNDVDFQRCCGSL